MSFFEESWEEREERKERKDKVCREIFGDTGAEIFPLSYEIFDRMNTSELILAGSHMAFLNVHQLAVEVHGLMYFGNV